jgi:hypothetical protein
VTLNDTNALDLAGSTVSGILTVTAGGTITVSGTLTVAGNATLNAGANAVVFSGSGNLNSAGNVTLTGNTITSGTELDFDVKGGTVTMNATTVGLNTNPLLVVGTFGCPGVGTCNPPSYNVNAGFQDVVNNIVQILAGIQAALTTEQSGPSELLTSGVLPENIFKSLGSQVLEIIGGGEGLGGFGSEGEGPVGVKILEAVQEIESVTKQIQETQVQTFEGETTKGVVLDLLEDLGSFFRSIFGLEKPEKKK